MKLVWSATIATALLQLLLTCEQVHGVDFADLGDYRNAEVSYSVDALPSDEYVEDTTDANAHVLLFANSVKQSNPAPAMPTSSGNDGKLASAFLPEGTTADTASNTEEMENTTPAPVTPKPSPTVMASGGDDTNDEDNSASPATSAPVTPKPSPTIPTIPTSVYTDDDDENDSGDGTSTPTPTLPTLPTSASPTTFTPVALQQNTEDEDDTNEDNATPSSPVTILPPATTREPTPSPSPTYTPELVPGPAATPVQILKNQGDEPWKQSVAQRVPNADTEPSVSNGGVNLFPYTADIRNYIVEQHNFARATMAPLEAANMRKLQWNEALAIEAAELVNTCVFEHDTENYAYGQNLMYGNPTIDRATVEDWMQAWVVNEISDGDRAGNGFMDLDHASAVLWANSYLVGCASKMCPNGHLTACNYHTPGNWQGEQAFIPGQACSQCPSQAPFCDAQYGKLCTSNPSETPVQRPPTPAPAPKPAPPPAPKPAPPPAPPAPAPKPVPGPPGPAPKPGQAPAPGAPGPKPGQAPAPGVPGQKPAPGAPGQNPVPGAPGQKPAPGVPAPMPTSAPGAKPAPGTAGKPTPGGSPGTGPGSSPTAAPGAGGKPGQPGSPTADGKDAPGQSPKQQEPGKKTSSSSGSGSGSGNGAKGTLVAPNKGTPSATTSPSSPSANATNATTTSAAPPSQPTMSTAATLLVAAITLVVLRPDLCL